MAGNAKVMQVAQKPVPRSAMPGPDRHSSALEERMRGPVVGVVVADHALDALGRDTRTEHDPSERRGRGQTVECPTPKLVSARRGL